MRAPHGEHLGFPARIRAPPAGGVVEKTFRAGEMLNTADMMKREAQYTYNEGDTYIFMDNESYEETRLKRDDEWAMYLKEGMTCELQFYNGKVSTRVCACVCVAR